MVLNQLSTRLRLEVFRGEDSNNIQYDNCRQQMACIGHPLLPEPVKHKKSNNRQAILPHNFRIIYPEPVIPIKGYIIKIITCLLAWTKLLLLSPEGFLH